MLYPPAHNQYMQAKIIGINFCANTGGLPSHSREHKQIFIWPGPSAEICRGILLYIFSRILPGIFLGDFSGHFPTKMWRKNPATRSAKKSGGPKIKIREKSVLPKSDPKFLRNNFPQNSHILEGLRFGANTCCACPG